MQVNQKLLSGGLTSEVQLHTNRSSTENDHIFARLNFAPATSVNASRERLAHRTLFICNIVW